MRSDVVLLALLKKVTVPRVQDTTMACRRNAAGSGPPLKSSKPVMRGNAKVLLQPFARHVGEFERSPFLSLFHSLINFPFFKSLRPHLARLIGSIASFGCPGRTCRGLRISRTWPPGPVSSTWHSYHRRCRRGPVEYHYREVSCSEPRCRAGSMF